MYYILDTSKMTGNDFMIILYVLLFCQYIMLGAMFMLALYKSKKDLIIWSIPLLPYIRMIFIH